MGVHQSKTVQNDHLSTLSKQGSLHSFDSKLEAEKIDEEIAVKILKVVGEIIEKPKGLTYSPQNISELKQLYEIFKSNGGPLARKMSKEHQQKDTNSRSLGLLPYTKKQKVEACQLYDPCASEATYLFIEHLEKELLQNNVSVQKVFNPSGIKNKLLLICNQASRIVTDVERCLKAVERTDFSRVVLVVIHVSEERALPVVSSKEHLLFENEKYRDLMDIIDVAFSTETGIYNCRMNDKANQAIYDALRS